MNLQNMKNQRILQHNSVNLCTELSKKKKKKKKKKTRATQLWNNPVRRNHLKQDNTEIWVHSQRRKGIV